MKIYNVKSLEKDFTWGKMDVLTLGERGRNRNFSIIPFHAQNGSELLEIGETKTGKPKIVNSTNKKNWLAVLNGEGAYIRNGYGSAFTSEKNVNKVKIIANGKGAFGEAGRIGDWYQYLAEIQDDTWVMVKPTRSEGYWLYFGEEKSHRVEIDEIDTFCELQGIPSPEGDELVDLYHYI